MPKTRTTMTTAMHKILYFFLLMIITSGWSSSKPPAPPKVNNILVFAPYADIRVIESRNKRQVDVYASTEVAKEISIQTKNILPDSIRRTSLQPGQQQYEAYAKAVTKIIKTCESQGSAKPYATIPDILIKPLDSLQQDFGLFIVYQGFKRTEDNYKDQYVAKKELSFYTSGLIDLVPIKSSASMVCLIIDRKNRKIKHYLKSTVRDRDPTLPYAIKSMVYHSLMSYFQQEK